MLEYNELSVTTTYKVQILKTQFNLTQYISYVFYLAALQIMIAPKCFNCRLH